MIIDGKSTRLAETKEVNKYIDEAWGDPHAIVTEDSEVFLELTDGPDGVSILVGGVPYYLHDRLGGIPVFLRTDGRITDVAYGPLFRTAAKFSPIPRIEWYKEQQHLIVIALKCAAAESEDRGHAEQAEQFRRIYLDLEE